MTWKLTGELLEYECLKGDLSKLQLWLPGRPIYAKLRGPAQSIPVVLSAGAFTWAKVGGGLVGGGEREGRTASSRRRSLTPGVRRGKRNCSMDGPQDPTTVLSHGIRSGGAMSFFHWKPLLLDR
ncbi:hypothetical protein [Oryza sativa Japonica Group]|uniref:Uncharacterized protein n=1 Tax=Oryza sativa subsp. japonica TaxID=39947 RepID=Q5N7H8_ORYSJ|nr:hypothetical protein [Oryza sativa Japonica Group]